MVYLIILAVWLGINCFVDVLNAIRYESGSKSGHALGVILRYATWAWLIYKIVQIY